MKQALLFFLCVIQIFGFPTETKKTYQGLSIVGGSDAAPGEFPYQIGLQSPEFYPSTICGGIVYDENFILTASHCTQGFNLTELIIVAGELDTSVASGYEQMRKAARVIRHPLYSHLTYENDVALIQVDIPFVFNEFVNRLPIPNQFQNFSGDCVVTGWGKLGQHGILNIPTVLQKVTVPIVSDEQCYRDYKDQKIVPTSSMICAGEPDKDSCQGDSGGPMACQGQLVGIVSWGYGCGMVGYPGVYTEVSYFSEWIVENAKVSPISVNKYN